MGTATYVVEKREDQPIPFNKCLSCFRKKNPKDASILYEMGLVGDHRDMIWSIQDGTACTISEGSLRTAGGPHGS
jgi:hypothetical protein